jgi:hypothetical protein
MISIEEQRKDIRIILNALIHDGLDVKNLSNKARAEIRAALDAVLRMARGTA